MCSKNHTISSAEVYKHAMQVVQQPLDIQDYGPQCTADTLIKILFYAAGECCSIFAACQRLRDAPCDQAVREALTTFFSDAGRLEEQLNHTLLQQLPKSFGKRRWRVAIDLTLIPYHGPPQQEEEAIYRSQAKSGTTHFHAYATSYLIHKGQRFTLALTYVKKHEPMEVVLKRLLHLTSRTGIRPKLLLLDRGFYAVRVIRYLQRDRDPFIMPVSNRGRKISDPRGPSGTQVFAARKQAGWSTRPSPILNNKKQPSPSPSIAATGTVPGIDMDDNPSSMPSGDSNPKRPIGFIRPIEHDLESKPVIDR